MNIIAFSEEILDSFEAFMREKIKADASPEGILEESMLYSIKSGGKRLRPLLLLATIQSFNEDARKGYEAAAALEWIHTYSLIHDDLPSMDDDDLRRGQATNHIVYGEATAILAGDALLTKAFDVITRGDLSAEIKIDLIQRLAVESGHQGMVGGQQADIVAEGEQVPLETLKSIHARKTGALLTFAMYAGGVISEQSEEVILMLVSASKHLGIAYQIRDDILDITSDRETLGKPVGSDEKNNKSTYPSLLTLEGSQDAYVFEMKQAYYYIEQIEEKLGEDAFDRELLESFIQLLEI